MDRLPQLLSSHTTLSLGMIRSLCWKVGEIQNEPRGLLLLRGPKLSKPYDHSFIILITPQREVGAWVGLLFLVRSSMLCIPEVGIPSSNPY